MGDDLRRLEERIDELAKRLSLVEEHVFSDEETFPHPSSPTKTEHAPVEASASGERLSAANIMSLAGRSLVVVGGAFLLRWSTQSGVLPQEIGSVIGMAYALLWIARADISARRGRRYSAIFHSLTGAFIALPLLVEATTKFQFLSPTTSAISLFMFVTIGLVVAGRGNIRVLAWIVALPAAPLPFVLASQTGALVPFLFSLLALGFATLWLGYLRHWHFLATLMAAAANIGLALMVMERVKTPYAAGVQEMGIGSALSLLFGLIALYFGSYCFRVFNRKRTITFLEIGNTLVVLLVGLGGAAVVVRTGEHSMLPLGIVCLVLSAACYSAAFGFLPRRDPNRRNFIFFTLLGLAAALLGCELTFERGVASIVFSLVALATGITAKRIASPVLYLHGAAYLLIASLRSGMLAATVHGYVGSSVSLAEWAGAAILLALAVTIVYPWLPKPGGRASDVFLGRVSVDIFLFATVMAAGSIVIALFVRFAPFDASADTYAGVVGSARTGVLALSAVILAWSSTRSRFKNLAWLVYMILALTAIKFVLEDVRAGGAATLFVSLGLYGGALILAPRFLRRIEKPAQ